MRWRSALVFLGALLLALSAPCAAASSHDGPVFRPGLAPGGYRARPSSGLRLLDPSKLRNYNQLIFSVSNTGPRYQGLFLSTFEYRLASPLEMSLTLGASLSPSNSFGYSSRGQFFLSSLRLTYRPTDSSVVQFVYQDPRGIAPYYYANPFAGRWWYGLR